MIINKQNKQAAWELRIAAVDSNEQATQKTSWSD